MSASHRSPNDGLELGDLLGGEERVEQLAVFGVQVAVEHQRDQWPACAERHRCEHQGLRVHGVNIAAPGNRDDVIQLCQGHAMAVLDQAWAGVDGDESLVQVGNAVLENPANVVVHAGPRVFGHTIPLRLRPSSSPIR